MKFGKKKKSTDFLEEEAKEELQNGAEYTLDIPEDEIWTYQIEGLQEPRINVAPKNATVKKIIVVITLLIAISLSIFLSIKALYNEEYEYEELGSSTYELVRYTNPGEVHEINIDYADNDKSKPITSIHEYAFNCDEQVRTINIGKDVEKIDSKSFYSCWSLQNIKVDPENEYYCDLDGVLYNKDMTELILYPIDHDRYLRLKKNYAYIGDDGEQHSKLVDDSGNEMEELWGTTEKYDDKYFAKYNTDVRTYVVPSTVEKIGELALAYSNITDLYLPEGLKTIDAMGIFKNTVLLNIFSYTAENTILDTTPNAIKNFKTQYNSLPEGLEYIGADCFTNDRGLSYMYIPNSVKYIGHHAFWDGVFKEDGELKGIAQMEVAKDETAFENETKIGNQWLPKYDKGLFKKDIDVNYSAQRK